jgi:peptidoglycan L-alanyl-D-glutamate endopeptidase CwlK
VFVLSEPSKLRLASVHADLRRVVERALAVSTLDFTIIEGLRSRERQAELLQSGATRTMHSRHLTGHAVDVAPWVFGIRWDWPLFFPIAAAVREASRDLSVPIEWGGVWDRVLGGLGPDLDAEVGAYVERVRHAGKKPFLDGPHFQLAWDAYPEDPGLSGSGG